ncbi:MAG: hypothetical protein AAF215_23825 [Cyanobacteria bacterium P01_A01_bin.123]
MQDLKFSAPSFGPGFFLTFLYYFSSTTLLASLVAAQSLHIPYGTGIPMQMGAAVGVFGGLLGGYLNRSATITVPFTSRKRFLPQLNATLTDMGYTKTKTLDDDNGEIWVYQRSILRQLLSGKIYVQMSDKTATITSRIVHLRGIRKGL